ncbi:MAG TPA: DUF4339 domain-containing protein [Clostridia bacterium]|nr:DUF4339 domain-containing protein [Clostridia bacterium]
MYKISCESIGDVKKYIWHYRKEDKEYGPFTYEDIVELVGKGEIGPEDYVLKFGNRKFVKAQEIQGLMDSAPNLEEKQSGEKDDQEALDVQEAQETHETEPGAVREEARTELQAAFGNNIGHMQKQQKKEPDGRKLAIMAAALLGLALAVWLLTLIF